MVYINFLISHRKLPDRHCLVCKGTSSFYLKRLVNAGFGKRILFGSDNMIWPGAIEAGIQTILQAKTLTAGEKRDILFNNAARFLRLSEKEIKEMYQ